MYNVRRHQTSASRRHGVEEERTREYISTDSWLLTPASLILFLGVQRDGSRLFSYCSPARQSMAWVPWPLQNNS